MAKETLEQMIKRTTDEYRGKDNVALLGDVSAGKTVVLALLMHTLTKSWIPKSRGKWEATVSDGNEEINEFIKNMKNGEFPWRTSGEDFAKVAVDVFNMKGRPVKFELVLHDIPGEHYVNLLTDKYDSIEDRLIKILSGDGSYLAHAKKYMIVIDCTEKMKWNPDGAYASRMIKTIKEIKQKIHNYDDTEQIHSPVAIIFTKSDALSEDDQLKSADKLVLDYPSLHSSLRSNHDGRSLRFFKVSVSADKENSDEIEKRLMIENHESQIKRDMELNDWNAQTENVIKDAEIQAISEAKESGYDEAVTREYVNQRIQQIKLDYKNRFEMNNPILFNATTPKKNWKLNNPLEFTESEYIRLISWMIEIDDEHDV